MSSAAPPANTGPASAPAPAPSPSPPPVSSPPTSPSSILTTPSPLPPTSLSSSLTTSSSISIRSDSPTSQSERQTPTPQQTPTPTPENTSHETTPTAPGIITVTNAATLSSGAPPITSTITSIFSSELVQTEPDGAIITTTIRSTIVIVPSGASSKSSSNTAAIAGGVAGGVAAICAIIIIFLFYWRRNRQREEFDGNFDPDRVVGHGGRTDLAGAEVTPYNFEPTAGAPSGPTSPTFSADGSMRQYRDSQALLGGSILEGAGAATATSGSHYAPTSSDGPPGSSSHARSSSLGSGGFGPGFPMAQPYRPLSAKEREAMRQRGEGGLGLASAPEEGEGDIVQHSDGGRIDEPVVPPSRPVQEIPPSYDSIPAKH